MTSKQNKLELQSIVNKGVLKPHFATATTTVKPTKKPAMHAFDNSPNQVSGTKKLHIFLGANSK